MAFKTKSQAEAAARRRRMGFRRTLKNVDKKESYLSGKNRIARKKFIRKAIKSVKVKKLPGKHTKGDTPYYLDGN